MLKIEPITKAKVKLYGSLRLKRYRRKTGLFIAEGPKLLQEALRSGYVPEAVVLHPKFDPNELPPLPASVKVYGANTSDFFALTNQPNPEGVVSVLNIPAPDPDPRLHLPAFALYDISDPGNLGTLLRTADWFGFPVVYASIGTADCFNPKVVRAAMGAIFRVRVYYLRDFTGFIQHYAEEVLAADTAGEPLTAQTARFRKLILLGNESHGLPDALLGAAGVQPVQIPGGGQAESLNVAVAGSIMAFAVAQAQL